MCRKADEDVACNLKFDSFAHFLKLNNNLNCCQKRAQQTDRQGRGTCRGARERERGKGEVEAQAQVGFSFIAGQKLKSKPNTQVAAQVGFVLITSRAALGASKAHTHTHTHTYAGTHIHSLAAFPVIVFMQLSWAAKCAFWPKANDSAGLLGACGICRNCR